MRIQTLDDLLSNIFLAVLSERYRDVADEIRACVIVHISKWIAAMPERFLDNRYLKFVAWALSDKVARGCCRARQYLSDWGGWLSCGAVAC